MNLRKTLLLAGMVLAVTALAAPAAQAGEQEHGLTDNSGGWLPDTTGVTFTSTNFKSETGLGTISCAKTITHFHVEHGGNNGEHVALNPTPAVTSNLTAENCRLNGSTVIHVSNAGTHTLTFDTWGHGETQSSFTWKITSVLGTITCTYSGKMTFQWHNGTNVVTYGPSKMASSCGEATVSGSSSVESVVDPVIGDFEETG
ncbi:MAG TPA: hypothetical protein VGK41_04310 [Solirubrobacterales bacterium]